MTAVVGLTPQEKSVVLAILRDMLPPGTEVSIFGSRATGQCKPWSDLDLSIKAEQPLPLATLASLVEAFDDSPLPWKVDIVDRRHVSEAFGALIDSSKILLERF